LDLLDDLFGGFGPDGGSVGEWRAQFLVQRASHVHVVVWVHTDVAAIPLDVETAEVRPSIRLIVPIDEPPVVVGILREEHVSLDAHVPPCFAALNECDHDAVSGLKAEHGSMERITRRD
jgi:hypothetical protein